MTEIIDYDTYLRQQEQQHWEHLDDVAEDEEIQRAIDENGDYPSGHPLNPLKRTFTAKTITLEGCLIYGWGEWRNTGRLSIFADIEYNSEMETLILSTAHDTFRNIAPRFDITIHWQH